LELLMRLAGLPTACALRQTCWALSKVALPEDQELALKFQRTKPSLPLKYHQCRRGAGVELCITRYWSSETLCASRRWRVEWALLANLTDAVPIRELLDAYYQMPTYANALTGSNLLRKRYVRNAIQDRMWDVCCGKDHYRDAYGRCITRDLSHEEVTDIVASMLHGVGLWYGTSAFYHTEHGGLGYTVFLLAAEQHNLPLVKYMHEFWGDANTIHSRTRDGNNAYALCKEHLVRMGHSEEQVRESRVLKYLVECGVEQAPLVPSLDDV
jgi:hypothetical protein